MSDDEREQNRQWLIRAGHTIHLRFYIEGHGFSIHHDHADCGELGDGVVTTERANEVTCAECLHRMQVAVDAALERGTI